MDRHREEGDKPKRKKKTEKGLTCIALSWLCPSADYLQVGLRRNTKGGAGEWTALKSLRKKGSVARTHSRVCGDEGWGSGEG